jgi:hypothetical protein
MQQDTLTKLQSIASIISSLAIPVVLAVFGWFVQAGISNDGIKKDYVQIAIGIIKDVDKNKDPELRAWALDILEKNSPVPFSNSLRSKLRDGALVIFAPCPPFPTPPEFLMKPPLVTPQIPKGPVISEKQLNEYAHESYLNAKTNEVTLTHLQKWAKSTQQTESDAKR